MRRLLVTLGALASLAPATAAADPLRSQQYGLDQVEADAAHRVTRGQGATVAVIDTGIRGGHPDLQGRFIAGRDFVDDDDAPEDGDGHGTHVAGIVAATKDNGIGISSVAPEARVLAVRVLGDDASGTSDDVARGIDFATSRRVDVINLSLGETAPLGSLGFGSSFDAAIDRALDAGIVVVAASGNNGFPVCEQPSAEGRLLCVGSIDRRRQRSFFSSFGRGLGLVAPGGSGLGGPEDILSTFRDPDYDYLAGTSFAAPHVAGVAALVASRGVRGQAAVRRLLETATDLGTPGPDPQFGAGLVNARAAVAGAGGGSSGGGAGGGGHGGQAGAGSAGRVWVSRGQRIRTVLRRGLVVRCRAAGTGSCQVTVELGRRRVASGSRRLSAGRTVRVPARVNRTGRRLLRRARRVRLVVRARLPGTPRQTRRVVLRR